MRYVKLGVAAALILALFVIAAGQLGLLRGKRPALGVGAAGKLEPCPSSPNCRSSESAADEGHRVEPLRYEGELPVARLRFEAMLSKRKRAVVIEDASTPTYLRAEFTSPLMKYVDDVEFRFEDATKTIHVRSASRLGRSDMGANLKRVEALRRAWDREPAILTPDADRGGAR